MSGKLRTLTRPALTNVLLPKSELRAGNAGVIAASFGADANTVCTAQRGFATGVPVADDDMGHRRLGTCPRQASSIVSPIRRRAATSWSASSMTTVSITSAVPIAAWPRRSSMPVSASSAKNSHHASISVGPTTSLVTRTAAHGSRPSLVRRRSPLQRRPMATHSTNPHSPSHRPATATSPCICSGAVSRRAVGNRNTAARSEGLPSSSSKTTEN